MYHQNGPKSLIFKKTVYIREKRLPIGVGVGNYCLDFGGVGLGFEWPTPIGIGNYFGFWRCLAWI